MKMIQIRRFNLMTAVILTIVFGMLSSLSSSMAQDTLTRPPQTILDLQWHPDGMKIARVNANGTVEVKNRITGHMEVSAAPAGDVQLYEAKLDWSSAGDRLAVGIGQQVYVWNMQNQRLILSLLSNNTSDFYQDEAGVTMAEGFVSVEWNDTDTQIMGLMVSTRLLVWSSINGTIQFDKIIGNNPVPLTWVSSGNLSTGNTEYNLTSQQFQQFNAPEPSNITCCMLFPSAVEANTSRTQIARGALNGYVSVVNAANGSYLSAVELGNNQVVTAVSWNPTNDRVAAVTLSGNVYVINPNDNTFQQISYVNGQLFAVDWSPSGAEISIGGVDNDGRSEFRTHVVRDITTRPPQTILDVQWHPVGTQLARVFANGTVEVIDRLTGQVEFSAAPAGNIQLYEAKLDWSSTGDRLAVGIGQQVFVWDMKSQQLRLTLSSSDTHAIYVSETGTIYPEGYVSLEWNNDDTEIMGFTLSSRLGVWSASNGIVQFDKIIGNNPIPLTWLNSTTLSNGDWQFDLTNQVYQSFNIPLPSDIACCIAFSNTLDSNSTRTQIAQGSTNGYVSVVGVANHIYLSVVDLGDDQFVTEVSWNPTNDRVAAVTLSGNVYVINPNDNTFQYIADVDGQLFAVDWSPSGAEISYGGVTNDGSSVFNFVAAPDGASS